MSMPVRAVMFKLRSTSQGSYNLTFVPKGAPVKAENTFNADFQSPIMSYVRYISAVTLEADDFVQKHGRVVVGGICETVGTVGGWAMRHGLLSPEFGLGMLLVILLIHKLMI